MNPAAPAGFLAAARQAKKNPASQRGCQPSELGRRPENGRAPPLFWLRRASGA